MKNKCIGTPLIIEFTGTEAELGPDCDCAVVAAEDLAENCLLRRDLMPFAMCSSQTCILTCLDPPRHDLQFSCTLWKEYYQRY